MSGNNKNSNYKAKDLNHQGDVNQHWFKFAKQTVRNTFKVRGHVKDIAAKSFWKNKYDNIMIMFRSNRLKDTLEATIKWKQLKLYDSENMKNRLVGEHFLLIFFTSH